MLNRVRQKLKRSLTSPGVNRAAGLLLRPRRVKGGTAEIARAKRILVLKPDGIGDVILATGFFRALRRQCPQAHITIAVKEAARELVTHPCFGDEVMMWKDEWCGTDLKPKAAMDLIESARAKWQAAPLDWVLIPRSGWDHANATMYAWWSGAANVCAHEYLCRDRGLHRHGFVNHIIPTPEMIHETEFHRRMLQFLKLDPDSHPRLEIPAAAEKKINQLFAPAPDRQKMLALGVGASHGSKRWPAGRFNELAKNLLLKWPDLTLFLIGGPEDRAIARAIAAGFGEAMVDATGRLSIPETAALLNHCALYVGNDSGPIHLAGAVGCTVVEMSKHPVSAHSYHECSPVRFGPVAVWSRVLQPRPQALECQTGCDKADAHCITDITVSQVMDTITEACAQAGVEKPN